MSRDGVKTLSAILRANSASSRCARLAEANHIASNGVPISRAGKVLQVSVLPQ
jgi:hypothetical protein